jgi:glycosyltransferase involved in cell wall biosynthesis
VGRFVPNKKFDDIILIFNYYNKFINSDSRLFLIGSPVGTEMYYDYLRSLVLQLDLKTVYFLGHVNFDDLLAYYRLADVFICMSEHEGFCVPLLEAMHFGVPVIAYKKAAVPETLGDAGILVNRKNFSEIAEMANLLFEDGDFREKVVKKEKQRLEYFTREKMEERLRDYLDPWLKS